MRLRSLLFCAGLAALSPAPLALGQSVVPQIGPLTVADAIARVVHAHPAVRASRARVAALDTRVAIETTLPPPMIDVQAWQWPRNTWRPWNAQWMVTLEQTLPARAKQRANALRARADVDVASVDVTRQVLTLAVDAVQAYADLRVARDTATLLDRDEALIRQVIDAAELRYGAGGGSQQDVLAGILELARVRDTRLVLERSAHLATVRLNLLMRSPASDGVESLESMRSDPGERLPSDADVLARVLAWHPDLQGLDREEARAAAARDAVIAERRPDYVVQGGWMSMPSMPDALTARVGVSWPTAPWSRRRLATQLTAAEADIALVNAQREAVVTRLTEQVATLMNTARANEARRTLIETTVMPPLEHARDVAHIDYANGRATLAPLLDLTRRLVDATRDVLTLRAERDRALLTLDVLTGDLVRAALNDLDPRPTSDAPTAIDEGGRVDQRRPRSTTGGGA